MPGATAPHFDGQTKIILAKIADTIRHLTIDAVQKANSGHPGLPLGCAEIGAYLYGYFLRHNPKNPHWAARDRLVLSAGHGSMWLYACLHLAGFDVSLEEIKHFRQLHSKTPGHPEYGVTPGVEATTGPLGQGVANAIGMALGLKKLEATFPSSGLFPNKVLFLASDGCMMEGVSSEASALAGHLQLDNIIGIYDANNVCLDGPLSECCSENTAERYMAYGWDTVAIDGHNFDQIHDAFTKARASTKPFLIIAKTIIGKGSPHKAGSSKAHGSPLGEEEVIATKTALGLPLEQFFIPSAVINHFKNKVPNDQLLEKEWEEKKNRYLGSSQEKKALWEAMSKTAPTPELEQRITALELKGAMPGRKASHEIANYLATQLPQLISGSGDLSCSDLTSIEKGGTIRAGDFSGRNIKFGVREFGMCAMASGMRLTGMLLPFIGTFLTFSDYMRNAIRLAAMSKLHVFYVFSHDSILLGEDGPTHQPIEHIASLRAIPQLQVIRPAGSHEVKMAWIAALRYQGPTALLVSRQNIPEIPETIVPYEEGVGRGAYIVKHATTPAQYTLVATGSELPLALDVARELEKLGKATRVISMPCWELFESQPRAYKKSVFGGECGKCVSIEAGSELGWYKYIGKDGLAISMDTFGASAPASALAKEFGFTVDDILERILASDT